MEKTEHAEAKARLAYHVKCQAVCSNFYDRAPDASLQEGCDIINKELFLGQKPVKCKVAEGQEKFPTFELYIIEQLLNGEGIRVDPDRMGYYKDLLGADFKRLQKRIDDGEVELAPHGKSSTIRYQQFRDKDHAIESVTEYIQQLDPKFTEDKLRAHLDESCSVEDFDRLPYTAKVGVIREHLLRKGIVSRRPDATKIARDLAPFVICEEEE